MEKKIEIFNVGDFAYLLDPAGVHTLEKYKSYKVIETDYNSHGDQVLALEGEEPEYIDYNGNPRYHFYNSRRFTKDLKPIRKKKLQKIKQKYYDETS